MVRSVAEPWAVHGNSRNGDGARSRQSSPSVLQRCLDWNWTCDTYDANSDDPILAPVDALVVTNDGFETSNWARCFGSSKPLMLSSSRRLFQSLYLWVRVQKINHASNRMFSVWSRPGFLLGIEREMGLGNVIQVVAGSDGSGLMCPVYTPRPQEVYPRVHKGNTGTGCPLTECTRHIPSHDLESAVSGAFAEPHCSSWFGGGKKYSLRWAGEGTHRPRRIHGAFLLSRVATEPRADLQIGRWADRDAAAVSSSWIEGDSGPYCAVLTPEAAKFTTNTKGSFWTSCGPRPLSTGSLPVSCRLLATKARAPASRCTGVGFNRRASELRGQKYGSACLGPAFPRSA